MSKLSSNDIKYILNKKKFIKTKQNLLDYLLFTENNFYKFTLSINNNYGKVDYNYSKADYNNIDQVFNQGYNNSYRSEYNRKYFM